MHYERLDALTDANNCMATHNPSVDPLGYTNCVRAAFGLPPVSAVSIPIIDNNTLNCLNTVLSKYVGPVDQSGVMHLPFQTVINMINEVKACVGLPPVNMPSSVMCIMNNCIANITPGPAPVDISNCVNNCIKMSP